MFIAAKTIERLRQSYPVGARVRLIFMSDPFTHIPEGTKGTVKCVDDMGTVHVSWDNGSSLGVIYGEDSCEVI